MRHAERISQKWLRCVATHRKCMPHSRRNLPTRDGARVRGAYVISAADNRDRQRERERERKRERLYTRACTQVRGQYRARARAEASTDSGSSEAALFRKRSDASRARVQFVTRQTIRESRGHGMHTTAAGQYVIMGQEVTQLSSRGAPAFSGRVRASNVARARRSVSYSRLSYGYTHRWIVFAVRMVTELFSPSPFPISVTHYPLENRHLSPWLSAVFPDPFPSWSGISLLVERSPSRSLPPSLALSLEKHG